MSLFQKSVQTKYLNEFDANLLDAKYADLKSYFGNPQIQENIRNAKEEQFQEGFLRELFVRVLGYTLNPEPNFNLTTEFKNVTSSKKADGAILKENKAIAVIELKSTTTADLDAVESQAFGYKNHHPNCLYIITSNFEKIRFYIQNAVDYLEFNLFTLTRDQFALLWLCLSQESIFKDLPLAIKNASVLQEENISKKLYADYSAFRTAIFNDIVASNPDKDKLVLFKKTQKLLDRFIFVFFAEDRQLLPPNSTAEIIKQWTDLRDKYDEYFPLYDRFKKYFGYLNTGHQGKHHDIYPYNGGLFAPDDILDNIAINDDILYRHTLKLSTYDFNTEVDVDILGHIFENSLEEIENVQAEIKGQDVDRKKSKRKKDGVYYTPKYITKYIVENTVGKLCDEKRKQLEISNEEFHVKKRKDVKKKLLGKLDTYREWLLGLTILDPACGSGAFLNQALDFLIEDHHKIDTLKANLLGDSLVLSDFETDILEKNIFGVDINEESVEIAKLSLWLRTARKGRKLNTLSDNIKCGNSLIDDPNIAGDKAFSWQNEFPDIFSRGGFDVILGNPPYVSNWSLSETQRDVVLWLDSNYKKDLIGHWDLFVCFISRSLDMVKANGFNSFILPTSFLKEKYGKLMRQRILDEFTLLEIKDFGEKIVFENVARQTFIYTIRKTTGPTNEVLIKLENNQSNSKINQQFFKKLKNCSIKTNVSPIDVSIYNKMHEESVQLGELFCINTGVVGHSKKGSPVSFKKDDVIYNEYKEGFKKYIVGSNLNRFFTFFDDQYLDYNSNKEHFHRPKFSLLFESSKIIVRRTSGNHNSILAYVDENQYYTNDNMMHLVRWNNKILKFQKPEKKWKIDIESKINLNYVASVLCSKLATYFFSKFLSTDTLQGSYSSIYPEDLRVIPLKIKNHSYVEHLSQFAIEISILKKSLFEKSNRFLNYLKSQYPSDKVSKKLENWYNLDTREFSVELKKYINKTNKKTLSKSEELEWIELFESKKPLIQKNQIEIENIDVEINKTIYMLYELTDEEINIVENSI
jgi:hypothetical protein